MNTTERTRRRRSRGRAYLLLARVSNLPTVWSNTLAGAATAMAVTSTSAAVVVPAAAAASLFYAGGMLLNDAFDAAFDAAHRPERPIPSGDVSRREVFTAGALLLVLGEAMLVADLVALVAGLALAAAIVFYDSRHKGIAWAPLVMGSCRGLVYAVAASLAGAISRTTLAGAVLMVGYVALLTVIARRAGARARWLVPALIAGISLLDALVIVVVSGSWPLAGVAAAGFPLTLAMQRVVPGD